MTQVRIVNQSGNPLPQYKTEGSAGMDLMASLEEPITLLPLERTLISTGLFIELPNGYEAQIRPRSGMAIKHGISLVNAVGTIDSDYRGEIKIATINLSNEPFTINSGDRIAQMIVAQYEQVELVQVDDLNETERGLGGFGSTGFSG
jgi:dUTP pyrophosphatase